MASSFPDILRSCSSIRRQYSDIFRIPSSYDIIPGATDKLVLIFNGALYSIPVSDFHLGMEDWRKIANERPKLNTRLLESVVCMYVAMYKYNCMHTKFIALS